MVMLALVLVVCMGITVPISAITEGAAAESASVGTIQVKEGQYVGDKAKPVKKDGHKPKGAPSTTSIFSKKTISTMNFEELKKSKEENVQAGDKKTAIKYLERMVPQCTDLDELKCIMLELAQLLYETESYTKAAKMYNEFTLLYPGSDEVELAMYKAIVSNFQLILDAEHDQTKTVETQEQAQAFLERPLFTRYKNEVQDILIKCEERLLESEINIFKFYLMRGNTIAANSRLEGIKKTYITKNLPDFQMKLAGLEQRYADVMGDLKLEQPVIIAAQDKDVKNETTNEKII